MEPLSRSSGSRAAESIGENGPETGEDVPEHFKDTSKSVLKDLEGDLAETERGNLGDSLPLPTASAYPRHGFRKSMIASAINTRLEVIRTEVNPLSEISGSLGDLGTLLPIIVALSKKSQINLSAALLFGGIYNILTGIYFNVPIPVQPMKSISSVALSNNYSMGEVMAAGFYVSAVVGFLGITGLILPISRLISKPLVRGMQLGTGIVFVMNGVKTMESSSGWDFTEFGWLDNYLLSILAFIGIFATYHARWTFSALSIFIVGVVIALVKIYVVYPSTPNNLHVGIHLPAAMVPDFGSRNAIVGAALGQIPLTTLNSVIAVSNLADDLFPNRQHPVIPLRSVSTSVGLMNIISCWFGSVPYCHGSGGLAGQYRFGARSGLSIVVFGLFKVLLALLFGSSLTYLLGYFPNSLLGVMLAITGIELGSVAKDVGPDHDRFVVMLVTAAALAGFRNDGIALICGLVVEILFYLAEEVKKGDILGLPSRMWSVFWDKVRGIEQKSVTKEEKDVVV